MKKSKVIIPAMALLLFSTAASITGTVAWFSSTRVFNTTASNFAINNVDGNLKAIVGGRIGTEAEDTDSDSVNDAIKPGKTTADAKEYTHRLYHGSFDYASSKAYILNQEPSGDDTDTYEDRDTEKAVYDGSSEKNWIARDKMVQTGTDAGNFTYYVAFSWQIDFGYTIGSGESSVAVYLDPAKTSLESTVTLANGSATADTFKGFRVAFYNVGATFTDAGVGSTEVAPTSAQLNAAKIWAPTGALTDKGFVNGEASNAHGTYPASGTVIQPVAANTPRHNEGDNPVTEGYADHICTLTPGTGKTVAWQRVICVAWFEGEDNVNVISEAKMNSVTLNLSFYARKISA